LVFRRDERYRGCWSAAGVLAKFNAIVTAGDNGRSDGSPLDNNALGFATIATGLVTTSTLAYGVTVLRRAARITSWW
jgi:hypothetical protein